MEASPTRRYVAHSTSSSHHPYRDRHTHPSPSTRKPQPLLAYHPLTCPYHAALSNLHLSRRPEHGAPQCRWSFHPLCLCTLPIESNAYRHSHIGFSPNRLSTGPDSSFGMERSDRRPPSTRHSTSLPIKTRGSLPTRFIPSRPPCEKDAPSNGTRCPRCCRHSIQRRDRPPARTLDRRLGSRRPFYSERMIYFPLGLIATALGTVLLPTFSNQAAQADRTAISNTLTTTLRHMLYIMIPAAVGLLWLSSPVLTTLFNWKGAFDTHSTHLAARALACYAPGLIIFSAAKLIVPAFYALQDTRTPVRIGIRVVGLNLLFNLLAVWLLPTYWKHAGMAAATVLAEGIGMLLLIRTLNNRLPPLPISSLITDVAQHLGRALIMGALTGLFFSFLLQLLPFAEKINQLIALTSAIAFGITIYLLLSRSRPEQQEIIQALRRKSK